MPSANVYDMDGQVVREENLDEYVFGAQVNSAVLHQVVTSQLVNRRQGTASTKTRAEVSGGGAKPWKQKGTGRARAGSTRAPNWSGGGVALGPKPRSYKQRTPKKMIRLALTSALSDRANEGKVAVVESWGFGETPSTKAAIALLSAIGVSGHVLVVVRPDDVVAAKSFRNLPEVHVLPSSDLNAYDVLCSDHVVFTSETLPTTASTTPVEVTV